MTLIEPGRRSVRGRTAAGEMKRYAVAIGVSASLLAAGSAALFLGKASAGLPPRPTVPVIEFLPSTAFLAWRKVYARGPSRVQRPRCEARRSIAPGLGWP